MGIRGYAQPRPLIRRHLAAGELRKTSEVDLKPGTFRLSERRGNLFTMPSERKVYEVNLESCGVP